MTFSTENKLIFAPSGNNASPQASQYKKGTLERESLLSSPFLQFNAWFEQAHKSAVHEPETVCLSTASLPSGRVSSRFVYLKELDDKGFVIYSNWGTSRKAEDILSNPSAALAFWWHEVERQVRVEGVAERLTPEESQRYYSLRARGSKLGAWASAQSSPLPEDQGGRKILEDKLKVIEDRFELVDDIPVPDFWGGLRIVPYSVEFWQGRDSRLHDRFRYTREISSPEQEWQITRLSP